MPLWGTFSPAKEWADGCCGAARLVSPLLSICRVVRFDGRSGQGRAIFKDGPHGLNSWRYPNGEETEEGQEVDGFQDYAESDR